METGTCMKYLFISFGSFVLYESVTHHPMTTKQITSLQNGLFKQRKYSEPLENHQIFKKGTQARAI